jgi:ADP-ribose pyrophosphatase YjhB (NUDIX family)
VEALVGGLVAEEEAAEEKAAEEIRVEVGLGVVAEVEWLAVAEVIKAHVLMEHLANMDLDSGRGLPFPLSIPFVSLPCGTQIQ